MNAMTNPRIIRKEEWEDWQRSQHLERRTLACMETALERSVLVWTQVLAEHQETLKQAQEAAHQESELLRQQARDLGRQEGLEHWLERLMVWTHYRRTRLSSLRDDMASLLCTVLFQILSSLTPEQWLTTVLNQLDPLIDGQHLLTIHVAQADCRGAADAVESWWRTAGWHGTAPQVLSSASLQPGQCRIVSAAGEIEVDVPSLLKAIQQCVLPQVSANDASSHTA